MAESGTPSPAKTTKAKAKKPAAPTGPKTLDLVVEAITNLADPKGASIPSLKSYLCEKCNAEPPQVKLRLKKALEKGLTSGVLIRPKNSAELGSSLSGRVKLNKAKIAADEKAKAKKEKAKAKAADKTKAKPAKKAVKKSPTKKTAAKKTKGSPKKSSTKSAASKLKTPKKTPSKAKSPKPKKQPAKSPKKVKSAEKKPKAAAKPKTSKPKAKK